MRGISKGKADEYDFIIVGQGLAGTCLSHALIERNLSVLVFDAPTLPASSQIAAGLFNPITGRNMVLTWKANALFDSMESFYRRLEKKLSAKLLYYMPLYRPFANIQEINEWQGRSSDARYDGFLESIHTKPMTPEFVKNELGGVMLNRTGYLDIKLLLKKYRAYLQQSEALIEDQLFPEKLNFNGDFVVYKQYSARKIIFCDGTNGFANKLMSKIKFHPLKGEVLRLQMDFNSEFILNRNGFVLPVKDDYLAGSNYNLTDNSWNPTTKARHEIIDKIDKILNCEYTVVDHMAGLRPTTHDRRPVLGLLPDNSSVGVFNGLGTKGVSLAPFFAEQLAEHLTGRGDLDSEVQIGRYFD